MRKLVTLLLAVAMVLSLLTVAVAEEPYTLDIYWVGNGDNEAVRAGVEEAVNAYIEPLIGAKVSYHIIGWGDWNDKAINALQSGEKMDLIFTADWEGYGKYLKQLENYLTKLANEGGTKTAAPAEEPAAAPAEEPAAAAEDEAA